MGIRSATGRGSTPATPAPSRVRLAALLCISLVWCVRAPAAVAQHGAPLPAPTSARVPAPIASPERPPQPSRLGPFEIRSAANDVLRLSVAGQLRLDVTNTPAADEGQRDTDATVRFRRVRLRVEARLLDERLSLSVQLSTVPGSLELLDLFADYRFSDQLSLRVGQYKTPYTRHRAMSYTSLALVDWAIAAVHFGAERQMGAMLHNGRADGRGFAYAAGIFTGENARASFATGVGRTFSEVLPNRSDLRTNLGPTDLHPELAARVAYGVEGVDAGINSDARRTGLRYHVSLSGTYDFDPERTRDFAGRVAPELLLKWRGLMLNLVGYAGFFETGSDHLAAGSLGAIGELACRFMERWEVAGRYSDVRILGRMRREARTRAAALIAAAGEEEQATVQAQYGSAGGTKSQQELGMGLTHYAIGTFLKAQLNASLLRTLAARERNDFVSQLQLQMEI